MRKETLNNVPGDQVDDVVRGWVLDGATRIDCTKENDTWTLTAWFQDNPD